MADVIVNHLLVKFTDVVFEEAVALYGLNDKVDHVMRDLEWIQCFLEDAESKSNKGDKRDKKWMREVREVSFLIEDSIDTFLIEVETLDAESHEEPCFCNILNMLSKELKKLLAKHNLNCAINKSQDRLKEIKESRQRYDINDLGQSSGGCGRSSNKRVVLPDVDEIDLVGFDDEQKKIIKLLLDESISRRSVVSIVGEGGLGKTTFAEKVYQRVKEMNHFNVHVWLTVSQEYKLTSLLKKIVENVKDIHIKENEYDEEWYIMEVNNILKDKRYFIVLDDVWIDHLWTQIQAALPVNGNASRVLITTRSWTIAKAADPKSDPYTLPFLNEDESLKLLLKKASAENCYDPDLLEHAKQLSNKCGGLPLALSVTGGLLSTKPQTAHAWDVVVQTMDWQNDGKKCTDILATSYDDLPVHLKTCFIYMALFPEDYEYDAALIISLWVAEGFIPHDAPGTREKVGETYLEELAQRSLVRVIYRDDDGSIEYYRVHDLLLDLATREAKEKNFLVVFSKHSNFRGIDVARRATFQLDHNDFFEGIEKFTKPTSPVRTLIFFGNVVPFDLHFRLLRVLMICDYTYHGGEKETLLLNNLNRLFHLRCLMFFSCRFPKSFLSINKFHKLQTLQILGCSGIFVHTSMESIFRMKTLKNVIVSGASMVIQVESALAPNPHIKKMYKSFVEEPSFTVTIKDYSREQTSKRVAELIHNYPYLEFEYLVLSDTVIPIENYATMFQDKYDSYQNLYLSGEFQPKGVELKRNMFPEYIKKLGLSQSGLDDDQMNALGSIQRLELGLHEGSYIGKKLICSNGFYGLEKIEICLLEELEELHIEEKSMPWLDELTIHNCPKFQAWHIEERALPSIKKLRIDKCPMWQEWDIGSRSMPLLKKLRIGWCPELQKLPSLEHMEDLRVLKVQGMSAEFIRRLKNEDRYKISHIVHVHYGDGL